MDDFTDACNGQIRAWRMNDSTNEGLDDHTPALHLLYNTSIILGILIPRYGLANLQ